VVYFDSLIIDERVDRNSCCSVIGLVDRTPVFYPEVCAGREDICRHRCRNGVHLFEVVRTVNHAYAAIVRTVIAAKSHPNLYVYTCQQLGKRRRPEGYSERTYQYPTNQ
jgi:hypothetical protein